jgi:osmotically-inducible protein OsmY
LAGLAGGCSASQPGDSSTPREYKIDQVTTAKVETALRNDRSLSAFNFNVETVDGSVELNGYVDRAPQRAAAGRDAAGVAGVTSVQNDVVVRSDPPKQP